MITPDWRVWLPKPTLKWYSVQRRFNVQRQDRELEVVCLRCLGTPMVLHHNVHVTTSTGLNQTHAARHFIPFKTNTNATFDTGCS